MFARKLREIWMALLLALAIVAPAHAASPGPGPGFKLNPESSLISPDGQIRLEQYYKDSKDHERVTYRFWTFDRAHRHAFLLNPGEDEDLAGYAAGFRFSPDSQWLVRSQKLGAGSQTLFLYRRNGYRFSTATAKPLGDLAWDYFFTTPASKGMHRDANDPYALDHAFVGLIKGMEENYAGMGERWPDSRYAVIGLSFDMQGEEVKTPWIEGWRCVYDLKTGEFSVPPDFAEYNTKAITYPDPPSK
jgi:hypothetical protein